MIDRAASALVFCARPPKDDADAEIHTSNSIRHLNNHLTGKARQHLIGLRQVI